MFDFKQSKLFSLRLSIVVIYTALSVYISMDLYTPSLPAIANHFDVTSRLSQFTITIYLVSFGLSQLFYGPLADRFGRKRMLLFGFLVFGLGSFVCVYATTIRGLIVGRFIQGVGVGACGVLSRVLSRDYFRGQDLALLNSYCAIFLDACVALSPFVGGILQDTLGYKSNFVFMLSYSLLGVFLLYVILPRSAHRTQDHFSLKTSVDVYWEKLKHLRLIGYAMLSGMALSTVIVILVINSFLIQNHYGQTSFVFGVAALVITTG